MDANATSHGGRGTSSHHEQPPTSWLTDCDVPSSARCRGGSHATLRKLRPMSTTSVDLTALVRRLDDQRTGGTLPYVQGELDMLLTTGPLQLEDGDLYETAPKSLAGSDAASTSGPASQDPRLSATGGSATPVPLQPLAGPKVVDSRHINRATPHRGIHRVVRARRGSTIAWLVCTRQHPGTCNLFEQGQSD